MVYQDEVEFSRSTGMQRLIACGGPNGFGAAPSIVIQSVTVAGRRRSGWFDTTNVQVDGNSVTATLVFVGEARIFDSLCDAHAAGQVDILAAEPFSVALRFG
jgi:hypothetical protein